MQVLRRSRIPFGVLTIRIRRSHEFECRPCCDTSSIAAPDFARRTVDQLGVLVIVVRAFGHPQRSYDCSPYRMLGTGFKHEVTEKLLKQTTAQIFFILKHKPCNKDVTRKAPCYTTPVCNTPGPVLHRMSQETVDVTNRPASYTCNTGCNKPARVLHLSRAPFMLQAMVIAPGFATLRWWSLQALGHSDHDRLASTA